MKPEKQELMKDIDFRVGFQERLTGAVTVCIFEQAGLA
jgi:hypothetical protein